MKMEYRITDEERNELNEERNEYQSCYCLDGMNEEMKRNLISEIKERNLTPEQRIKIDEDLKIYINKLKERINKIIK